jgi:hypothetical protein
MQQYSNYLPPFMAKEFVTVLLLFHKNADEQSIRDIWACILENTRAVQ